MFDDARAFYQDLVLQRSRHPLHARRPEKFDASAKGDNPMCGDRCEVFVRLGTGGTVGEVGFNARGCAISVASADLMAEAVNGQDIAEALAMAAGAPDIVQGVSGDGGAVLQAGEAVRLLAQMRDFPTREKCATLPWQALAAALAQVKETAGG